jgi:hypothetical protein
LLYESYNNIGCDDDDDDEEEEEEVDSDDDMEYTKDAIYKRYDFRIFKRLI